jgi:thiamine-phosphate pyrophosphorylase
MKNGLPRLYPILDTGTLTRRGCEEWIMAARGMLAGGAQILQIRHKGEWTAEAFAQAVAIAAECRNAGATLIVNDRADMAKLLQAGVHVGQDDLTPRDIRLVIGDEPPVGFSTHNAEQMEAAASEPVDYLAFGPIFATASKENPDPVAGMDRLAHARTLSAKPLVAIGGITRATAEAVLAAGADSVAIIGDLLPVTLSESAIRNRMEEWQRLLQ